MKDDAAISWLMFFTLAAAVVVGTALLISFLRSRHNREIAANALEGDGRSHHGEPSGAGASLSRWLSLPRSRWGCSRLAIHRGATQRRRR